MGNNILDHLPKGTGESSGDSTPYDAWEHICADAFDDDSERGAVALVAAYFDAAYNHPKGRSINDPRIHTVATYIADKDDWRKLRKEWREKLREYNVPYFHMKDFEIARNVTKFQTGRISSKSPYLGWPLEKFESFERCLHSIINRKKPGGTARIASITSNIVLNDYEETLPDDLKDHPRCRSHFVLNVANVMEGVALWANTSNYYDDPIHYIFADGDDETGNLDRWFSRCFERDLTINHYRLGKGFTRMGYDLQWMKQEPALQAVDCPAYELNRAVIEWAKGDFNPILKSELRKSLSSLCRIDHFGVTLRKPELIESFEAIRANDKRLGF